MIKRYNHKDMPMDMVESNNGYWVRYEDYERAELDCNKKLERNWSIGTDLQSKATLENESKLEKQQVVITVLSTILFAFFAIFVFTWL